MPGWQLMSIASPSRMTRWSSTLNTRIPAPMTPNSFLILTRLAVTQITGSCDAHHSPLLIDRGMSQHSQSVLNVDQLGQGLPMPWVRAIARILLAYHLETRSRDRMAHVLTFASQGCNFFEHILREPCRQTGWIPCRAQLSSLRAAQYQLWLGFLAFHSRAIHAPQLELPRAHKRLRKLLLRRNPELIGPLI